VIDTPFRKKNKKGGGTKSRTVLKKGQGRVSKSGMSKIGVPVPEKTGVKRKGW